MNHLLVVWSNTDIHTIENFIILYSKNAKRFGWFDEVNVLIWGASQKVLSTNLNLQKQVKEMIDMKIDIYGCKVCADELDVSKQLEEIGVKIQYTGEFLSNCLKNDKVKVLSI